MINIQQNALWTSAIFEVDMPDFQSIKKELVDYLQVCEVKKPEGELLDGQQGGIGPHAQNHKKYLKESYPTLFDNTDSDALSEVKAFCLNVTLDIAKNVNSRYTDTSNWVLRPTESWYHITKDRGYHDNHAHPHSPWCGIFYVDKGDANNDTHNGINRFYSPLSVHPLTGNEYMTYNFHDIEIKEGKLIVFPGYLEHCALPYYGDKDRILISYNTEFADARSIST